jgi:hypothetical protein
MALNVFPVDAVSGAPSYTARMARQTLGALTSGATAARPLGARSGVIVGTGVSASATSSTWTVLPHKGVLDLEANATAGPYLYSIDANVTGAMTAAHATLDRIDLLSILLSDPAEGDGTAAPSVQVVYTAGTAASTPVAPATPARSMYLSAINVPHSGGGSPTVTWNPSYTTAAGGIIPCIGTGYRPPSPYLGQYIDDPAAGLLRWNGTIWTAPTAVAYSARNQTAGFNVPTSANTVITGWTVQNAASELGITYASGSWTIVTAGFYLMHGQIAWQDVTTPTGQRIGRIMVNSTIVHENAHRSDTVLNTHNPVMHGMWLNVGDTVAVSAYQSHGVTLPLQDAPGQTHFHIARVAS